MKLAACFLLLFTLGVAGPALPSPAAPGSGESSLVTGPDGTVYLTWSGPADRESERALTFATLAPGATAWSAPRIITRTPLLMENWADFATLTVGTDGQLWAQWYESPPGGTGHGYRGWFARSADQGATWTKPAPLGHEFVSLAPLSGGRLLAVWLESTGSGNGHGPRDPHAPYAPAMRLMARLLAPDGAALRDWIVDSDVCTCCQTTLARPGGDQVLVAYRGHRPDETRDNLVARFDGDAWDPPRTLHDDGWKIAACPVNGPAADAAGDRVAVTWFTAANGVARVQAKLSADGGRTFGPALPIDLGRPIGRLDLVMLGDGSALVSWLESKSGNNDAGLYVRRVFPDGGMSAPHLVTATTAVRAGGFPRLAARPGEHLPVVVSWTDAVPADPKNPKSAATTRVLTELVEAAGLPRQASPLRSVAVPPARPTVALELCGGPTD